MPALNSKYENSFGLYLYINYFIYLFIAKLDLGVLNGQSSKMLYLAGQ